MSQAVLHAMAASQLRSQASMPWLTGNSAPLSGAQYAAIDVEDGAVAWRLENDLCIMKPGAAHRCQDKGTLRFIGGTKN